MTIISGKNKRINFLGKIFKGSQHDYAILKIEFPIWKKYFVFFYILIDLGYLGFQKDYDCINVLIPVKKPRKTKLNPNPQLTKEEKEFNKSVSRERIYVENAISGLKRYNIISNRVRVKKEKYRENKIVLCASLWNFYLAS
jgi:hypothetical protein